MNMFWLYDLPNSLMGCLIVSFFVGLSLLGLLAGRRCFAMQSHSERGTHNDLVSYFLSAIGAIYGITIGLLAAGTWSNFSAVSEAAMVEASSLAALYRDVSSLPLPYRSELQQKLKEHTRFEIDKQWPAHQQGKVLPSTSLTAFQAALLQVNPESEQDKILYAEAFSQFNTYVENRIIRLSHVTSGLPATLWSVVFLGAALTIGVSWFFQIPAFSLHAALTAILSGLIGLLVFVIVSMDWPFRGEFSVSPEAMQTVYENLMKNPAMFPPSVPPQ